MIRRFSPPAASSLQDAGAASAGDVIEAGGDNVTTAPADTNAPPPVKTGQNGISAPRAALDFLNILQSLAPIFRAVTIYPGHNAAPETVAAAVRVLSGVSVALAEFVAVNGDVIEIDALWARRTLHEFTAELVSTHWISTVISHGGATGMPEISPDYFKPAIRVVMALPGELPKGRDDTLMSLTGAINLALLKGMTPIAIEIERYCGFIAQHVPAGNVSVEHLVQDIGQFLMEQALSHYDRYVSENQDALDDDKRVLLQALIGHAASVILSAWEYCKGEVYAAISEAQSAASALDVLAQPTFEYGFPLQQLKSRTEESLRRLVRSATYAASMMPKQSEEPKA